MQLFSIVPDTSQKIYILYFRGKLGEDVVQAWSAGFFSRVMRLSEQYQPPVLPTGRLVDFVLFCFVFVSTLSFRINAINVSLHEVMYKAKSVQKQTLEPSHATVKHGVVKFGLTRRAVVQLGHQLERVPQVPGEIFCPGYYAYRAYCIQLVTWS